jgi:hypothetical protein
MPVSSESQWSNSGFVNLPLEPVNRSSDDFQLRMIVGGKRFGTLLLQLADARFDCSLVYAHNTMMFVLNPEGFCNGDQKMLLVELGVALNSIIFDAFGDVP